MIQEPQGNTDFMQGVGGGINAILAALQAKDKRRMEQTAADHLFQKKENSISNMSAGGMDASEIAQIMATLYPK